MRRKSREMALQILFQSEFAEPISLEQLLEANTSSDEPQEKIPADALLYARTLIKGVQDNQPSIDALIRGASAHWKIERMATIDRNLLRIAVYELKFMEPALNPAIAINEAIELAKIYGGEDSKNFINGLLDQVAKGL